jgi:hypothetical protein
MRVFFNLENGSQKIIDAKGVEVSEVDQIYEDVVGVLREMTHRMADDIRGDGWFLHVVDATGELLLVLNLDQFGYGDAQGANNVS